MNEGLVAPSWSDSGDLPVGEVTCIRLDFDPLMTAEECAAGAVTGASAELTAAADGLTWKQGNPLGLWWTPTSVRLVPEAEHYFKPSDPNAKPALSALSKVAGESYRGLGWCDEEGAA